MGSNVVKVPRLLKSTGFAFLAFFILAAVVRIIYLGHLSSSPTYQVFQVDSLWYAQSALQIAEGELTNGEPFWRAPLYSYFLAALCKASGSDFGVIHIVQHLLGALSCSVVFLIARRTFNEGTAIVSALIYAFYGPLIHSENQLMATSLAVFLFLLTVLAACRAAQVPSMQKWLTCGLLLGLACMTRPNFLVLLPLILGWWLLSQRKTRNLRQLVSDMGMFCLGAWLTIMPATIHNVICGGEWILIASQGGINFYIGNNSSADGKTSWAPRNSEQIGLLYMDDVQYGSRVVAEEALGRQLSETEVSSYWFCMGIDFWKESPGKAAMLTLKKAYYYLNGFEIDSNQSMYLDGRWSGLAKVLIRAGVIAFPLGIVFPLAILGMIYSAPDQRLARLLRLAVILYSLSIIAFLVSGRLRIPVVPLLIIFAAHALYRIYSHIRQRRKVKLAITLSVLLGLVLFSNSKYLNVREVDYAWQLSLVANAHNELGQYQEAVAIYRQALEYSPDDYLCRYNLGCALQSLQQTAMAVLEFRRAIQISPESAKAHNTLGVVLQEQGNLQGAMECFQRAIICVPEYEIAHANLGYCLFLQDRPQEAMASLLRALELNSNCAEAHLNLSTVLAHSGDYQEAWRHVRQAQQLGIAVDPRFLEVLSRKMSEPR